MPVQVVEHEVTAKITLHVRGLKAEKAKAAIKRVKSVDIPLSLELDERLDDKTGIIRCR